MKSKYSFNYIILTIAFIISLSLGVYYNFQENYDKANHEFLWAILFSIPLAKRDIIDALKNKK